MISGHCGLNQGRSFKTEVIGKLGNRIGWDGHILGRGSLNVPESDLLQVPAKMSLAPATHIAEITRNHAMADNPVTDAKVGDIISQLDNSSSVFMPKHKRIAQVFVF